MIQRLPQLVLGTTNAIHQNVACCVQDMCQQEESGPVAIKKQRATEYQSASGQEGDEMEDNGLDLAGKHSGADMPEFALQSLDSCCIADVTLFVSGDVSLSCFQNV